MTEQAIHKAILGYLRTTLPHGWVIQHTPNKPRSMVAGAIEKSMGAIKGWPDLAVYGPGSVHFIEVKAEKGRLSDAQWLVHDGLRDLGFPVTVVRSVDDVRAKVKEWGLPSKDADTWISLGDAVTGAIEGFARRAAE